MVYKYTAKWKICVLFAFVVLFCWHFLLSTILSRRRSHIYITSTSAPVVPSICVMLKGRLGNQMFEYASNFGIAQKKHLTVAVQNRSELLKIFTLTAKTANCKCSEHLSENKGCTFEKRLMEFGGKLNVCINGYLQSWKYFHNSLQELRKEFQFVDAIKMAANRQFLKLVQNKCNNITKCTYIGVQVRRGDMVKHSMFVKYGYVSANQAYLQKAMDYFRTKFKLSLFIVASDDIAWCKKNIKRSDVVFVENKNRPEVDMALLSMCNHTVMTVGSYGWWAGWLTGGEVIYYKGYPRPGSQLASVTNLEDYRFPGWIPM